MKIEKLSAAAQAGLRAWAEYQHGAAQYLDGSEPAEWAWVCFQLRAANDKPEWFPKGKWATIQVIEGFLNQEAENERRR